MAWRRPGDKPLSEPMMARLLTHICVTRPQWVNQSGRKLKLGSNSLTKFYQPSNQRPGSSRHSGECHLKFIRPGETHNKFTHHLSSIQQWFIYKCAETAWLIRGQKTVEFHRSLTPNWWCLVIPIIRVPTKSDSVRSVVCLQMIGNCLTNRRPGNSRNSAKYNQKLIMPGESHNNRLWYYCHGLPMKYCLQWKTIKDTRV